MHYDVVGVYTLKYTATDDCGNETIKEREVIVGTPRTVLYSDGTFIINESPKDQLINEARHGGSTNVYDPFDPNGDTDIKKYIFTSDSQQPWRSERLGIKYVEVGSNISPISTAYWFMNLNNCESMNLSNLDTASVTDMNYMFANCSAESFSLDLSPLNTSNVTSMRFMFRGLSVTSLDVSPLNTSKVTDMFCMFYSCKKLTALDLSTFDTSNVTNMQSMFFDCFALTSVDLSNFDTSNVTTMYGMFNDCYALAMADLSSFDTSNVTNMTSMFRYCYALTTIYASASFVVSQVTDSVNMFGDMQPTGGTASLVGGAGTAWNSGKKNKEYARIDNPPSAPGYFTARP